MFHVLVLVVLSELPRYTPSSSFIPPALYSFFSTFKMKEPGTGDQLAFVEALGLIPLPHMVNHSHLQL